MWLEKRKGKQIKKEKKERKEEERRTQQIESERRERESETGKKKVFRFSLRSTKIGPSVFVGAKGKVD